MDDPLSALLAQDVAREADVEAAAAEEIARQAAAADARRSAARIVTSPTSPPLTPVRQVHLSTGLSGNHKPSPLPVMRMTECIPPVPVVRSTASTQTLEAESGVEIWFERFLELFGATNPSSIPSFNLKMLLSHSLRGDIHSPALRGLSWRVFMQLLPSFSRVDGDKHYSQILLEETEKYRLHRELMFPPLTALDGDPLSAFSVGSSNQSGSGSTPTGGNGHDWDIYSFRQELQSIVEGDLDRLYLTGVPDDFFQCAHRRSLLLRVLSVWSCEHPDISYRQGMHEIVGVLLYVLECERDSWKSLYDFALQSPSKVEQIWRRSAPNSDFTFDQPITEWLSMSDLVQCLQGGEGKNYLSSPLALAAVLGCEDLTVGSNGEKLIYDLEAQTYSLFSRIMQELISLYDPEPTSGKDALPYIVQYCEQLQTHYLRQVDAPLADHLEAMQIQPQLYGLRWARLMLGREFDVRPTALLLLWDHLFSCSLSGELEMLSAEEIEEERQESGFGRTSLMARVQERQTNAMTNVGRRARDGVKTTYEVTPLTASLGDMMLSLLIHIRHELLEADSMSVLTYLMRYPDNLPIASILETTELIRKGQYHPTIIQPSSTASSVTSESSAKQTTSSISTGFFSPQNAEKSRRHPDASPIFSSLPKVDIAPALSAMGSFFNSIGTGVANVGRRQPQPSPVPITKTAPIVYPPLGGLSPVPTPAPITREPLIVPANDTFSSIPTSDSLTPSSRDQAIDLVVSELYAMAALGHPGMEALADVLLGTIKPSDYRRSWDTATTQMSGRNSDVTIEDTPFKDVSSPIPTTHSLDFLN